MRFPGRSLAKYVLERLGGSLREQYDAVVDQDPPDRLKRLLARLQIRAVEQPKRGTGGARHFTGR
jgi:Anti-sigma factor NepR